MSDLEWKGQHEVDAGGVGWFHQVLSKYKNLPCPESDVCAPLHYNSGCVSWTKLRKNNKCSTNLSWITVWVNSATRQGGVQGIEGVAEPSWERLRMGRVLQDRLHPLGFIEHLPAKMAFRPSPRPWGGISAGEWTGCDQQDPACHRN